MNFVDHESAKNAADELNYTEFKGKKIFVGRAQKRTERDDELRKSHEAQRMENEAKSAGVNLYVKNLDGKFSNPSSLDTYPTKMNGMTIVFVPSSIPSVPSQAAKL